MESQSSLDQNGQPGEEKPVWHEEEPEPLESHEEKRLQEEYWRELEAKCKRQKAEAAEKRRLEEQRRQALERRLWEESLRQELLEEEEEAEEAGAQLEAGQAPGGDGRQAGPEELRGAEQERGDTSDPARLEAAERRREQEEAEGQVEKPRQGDAQKQEEEERGQREAEKQEEKPRQEEEPRQGDAQKQEEEVRQREAETQEEKPRQLGTDGERPRDEETKRMPREGEEAEPTEEPRGREEEAPEPPVEGGPPGPPAGAAEQQGPPQKDPGKAEGPENADAAGRRETAEEQTGEAAGPRGDSDAEGTGAAQTDIPRPQGGPTGTPGAPDDREDTAADGDRNGEELRWREVEERQSTPRPYTFQVSSGSRQILFPKVNLTPVTPARDAGLAPATQEPPAPRGALPSALSIPHTAILVTGAQLCGPAVNLSQIKDTACKSLLGLSEERRPVDVPAGEPRAGGGKARPPPESPGGATALAEWASIRSRILKTAEGDQRGDREPPRPGDEPAPRARCDSRGNARRTPPPLNAKFSIMPAWQKFSDGGAEPSRQGPDSESVRKKPPGPAPGEETAPQPLPAAAAPEPQKSLEKQEASQEPPDATDGCKFAKDLPSFLVPGLPSPQRAASRTESTTALDSETASDVGEPDPAMPGGDEKASPFGIKLRRTNYSLRFHCDQQAEQKKKKRHSSTGEGVDGGTPAAGSAPGEREPETVALKHGPSLPQDRKPALSPRRDSVESHSSGPSVAVAQPGPPAASSQTPAPEHDKAASKTPPMQKPALAPKPASQTPPSSPLSKLSRPHLVELLARRAGKLDSEPCEMRKESQESSENQPPSPSLPEEPMRQKKDEEEMLEKKPASPPLPASQQERPSLTPETGRKGM